MVRRGDRRGGATCAAGVKSVKIYNQYHSTPTGKSNQRLHITYQLPQLLILQTEMRIRRCSIN